MPVPAHDLTTLLNRAARGDKEAEDAAWGHVYQELRVVARGQLRRLRPGETLDTTALVHEAYLKLTRHHQNGEARRPWQGRKHFYVVAARAMRQILINYAERQQALKRGGGQVRVPLEAATAELATERAEHLLVIDRALTRLAVEHPRLAQAVELRFFGGLTTEDVAEVLGVSARTAWRDWAKARRWLALALAEHDDAASGS